MSIPKYKKYFLFLPLDNLAGVCYTIRANSKKAVPVLSPAKEVIVSIFEAVASFVVPKNHLIIFLFSHLSIVIFKKNIFLFSLLTRRGKSLYNVFGLFLPGLFVTSYRWSIKGRSSFEGRPFFIAKSTNYSAFLEWVNTQNLRKNILFFLLTTKENPI